MARKRQPSEPEPRAPSGNGNAKGYVPNLSLSRAARLGEQAVVRAMTDIGNSVIEVSKFGFAVFVLGVLRAARGNGGLPRWLVRLGLVAVPALLVSAVALFVDRGPFQFGGMIDLGGSVPALLWILGLSFVMMRARPRTVATP